MKHSGKNILSGIQPTGQLHLGNYLGAIRQWVDFQNTISNEDTFLFMLADLNAITVAFDPEHIRENIVSLTAWLLAAGLDPEKVTLFQQSGNPDHTTMTWLFSCLTPMGWLERMIQYKEKSKKQGKRASVGLFVYPNLQAADILLYDSHEVPVGDDQVQHVELARDIAKKFNNEFGETFVVPKITVQKKSARIMSLQDPSKKMSKSDDNQNGVIRLIDDADTIRKKVMKAVTDSGTDIVAGDDKPAMTNLLSIYAACSGQSIDQIENEYRGKQYGEFKKDLADIVISTLTPIQERYHSHMSNQDYVHSILDQGLDSAQAISSKKTAEVMQRLGLARNS